MFPHIDGAGLGASKTRTRRVLEDGRCTTKRGPYRGGLMPAPENPPLQMLLIDKADKATESGGRSPQQKAALECLAGPGPRARVLDSLSRY